MSFITRKFRRIYSDMLLTFLLFGIANTILGSVLPRILEDFGWTYSATGIIIAGSAVGYFVSTFVFGYLVNSLGLRTILVSSLVLLGVSNLLLGRTGSIVFNLIVNTLIGIGHGGLEVVVNTSVVRMEREGESHLMGFAHASYSIGAVVGPLAAGAFLAAGEEWQLTFRVMGVLFLAAAAVPFFLPFERLKSSSPPAVHPGEPVGEPVETSGPQGRPSKGFRKGAGSIVFLGALTIFLYVGLELGVSNWAAEYFVKRFAVTSATATVVIALFWAGILAGRVTVPLIAKKAALTLKLLLLAVLCAVSVTAVIILPGAVSSGAALFLAGLGCSSMYPLVMSLIGKYLGENQSVGLGIVSSAGGVGSFAFPFLMALLSQEFGIVTGFSFFAFMGGLVIASCVAMFIRVRSLSHGIH